MIVTFCGHSFMFPTDEMEKKFFEILEKEVGDNPVDFYLGEYGRFDYFARECCIKYREKHEKAKLFFVTPYLTPSYLERKEYMYAKIFDGIVAPDIEGVMPKFSILKRNMWMVESADLIIAFVDTPLGGAAKTLLHATKLNKKYYNLGVLTEFKY